MSDDNSKSEAVETQSPSISKGSGTRSAVYGFLGAITGAIIGLLGTFVGSYYTGHQAQSENQVASERSAYAEFGSTAAQFVNDLSYLTHIIQTHDDKSYAQLHGNLLAQVPSLYRNFYSISLLSPSNIRADALNVVMATNEYYIPVDPSAATNGQIHREYQDCASALMNFRSAVTAQMNP